MKSKKQKVCIVEDDQFIQDIYKVELTNSGFEVVSASDGEEGLAIIKKELPDVALVDVMMPKLSGTDLVKLMKEDAVLAKIPVIMLTNASDEETIEKAKDAQFYLVKAHYDPKDVVGIVREVLSRAS
jgi:DNA-binding response OmpR family regulator